MASYIIGSILLYEYCFDALFCYRKFVCTKYLLRVIDGLL